MVKYFPILIILMYLSSIAPVLGLQAVTKTADDKGHDMFPAFFFGHVPYFYQILSFLSNIFPSSSCFLLPVPVLLVVPLFQLP